MKKIILILIIFIYTYANNITLSQWVTQNSGITSHLIEIRFINQYTGWACGINGVILKTTNGGINWIQQPTGINDKPIWRIRPIDANTVYCIGSFETFLKTTNGGTNWQIIKNGPLGQGHSYYALHFINQNTGWYTGTGQLIFKTTNGGLTIDSFFINGNFLKDIYFKDNNNGITCGDGGIMLKTSNSGLGWYQVIVPLGSESSNFYDITFIGDNGWIVGSQNNKVYKTTNFGSTCDSVVRIVQNTNISSGSIYFSSLNTGWVAGSNAVVGDAGRIYKTTNGGYNWYQQDADNYYPNSSIFFITDSIGWCVGNFGKILHTTTGGQIVGIANTENKTPDEFSLSQNYPNPFNSQTLIEYKIKKQTHIKISIFNTLGEEIEILINEYEKAGTYSIVWNAQDLSSGVYFYKLEAGSYINTKKMVLIK